MNSGMIGKALSAIAVVALLGLVVSIFVIRPTADDGWRQVRERVEELRGEIHSFEIQRPPLRDPSIPGNAWDDYGKALSQMRSAFENGRGVEFLDDFLQDRGQGSRAKVEEALAQCGESLILLGQGARRPHSLPPENLGDDPDFALSAVDLGKLAVCRARILSENGQFLESAHVLLDACQFARDLANAGPLVAVSVASWIFDKSLGDMAALVSHAKGNRNELAQIDVSLERLDADFPSFSRALLRERLSIGGAFLKGENRGDPGLAETVAAWRYGFSSRLMIAEGFLEWDRILSRFAQAATLPWPSVLEACNRLKEEATRSGNDLVRMSFVGDPRLIRARRDCHARLRLLRAAIYWQLHGETLDLEDPFGSRIRQEPSADRLRVSSVGAGEEIALDVKPLPH